MSFSALRLRSLPNNGRDVLEEHWPSVPPYFRGAVRAVFRQTYDGGALGMAASVHFRELYDEEHGSVALEWLKTPIAFEVKFAEATSHRRTGDRLEKFAETVENLEDGALSDRRLEDIRRLSEATRAFESSVDLSLALGYGVASLVNVTLPKSQRRSDEELRALVEQERDQVQADAGYLAAVLASLLYRYRDLGDEDLDAYVEFAESESGRWYHRAINKALVAALLDQPLRFEEAVVAQAGQATARDMNLKTLALPSGRTVYVLGFRSMPYPGAEELLFNLRYRTSLALEEENAVREEAGEVWEALRHHVENTELKVAVLEVAEPMPGIVFTKAATRVFLLRRDEEGDWLFSEDGSEDISLEKLHGTMEALRRLPP